jgi:hypothetical protein
MTGHDLEARIDQQDPNCVDDDNYDDNNGDE